MTWNWTGTLIYSLKITTTQITITGNTLLAASCILLVNSFWTVFYGIPSSAFCLEITSVLCPSWSECSALGPSLQELTGLFQLTEGTELSSRRLLIYHLAALPIQLLSLPFLGCHATIWYRWRAEHRSEYVTIYSCVHAYIYIQSIGTQRTPSGPD
jgi:hypothetical protein